MIDKGAEKKKKHDEPRFPLRYHGESWHPIRYCGGTQCKKFPYFKKRKKRLRVCNDSRTLGRVFRKCP